ncbi:DUF5363 family protein [Shewanella avicenniae]|uniref:DUF5363 family protein n=1 Tax=Shewanella avicenniae TaxID=2814294 RepID=A0ABX7QUK3_9GAMM|nr:DUF5363 family protein [Shewanella avicenniae]QSX34528.1 DUF5363 family protein [Shewanella avicenniae]
MNHLVGFIKRAWQGYTGWCDKMGLTEENRRCCMPRLYDPPLDKAANNPTTDTQAKEPQQ